MLILFFLVESLGQENNKPNFKTTAIFGFTSVIVS
jgi:hypothetical protein